jgi:flagellar hook-associated protein 3 FlgL
MTRVTNFSQNELTLFYLQGTQQRMTDTQNQISTGLVSQDYAGLGADTSRLVNLQSAESRLNQYSNNAKTVDQRLTSMETATSQMFTIASNLQTLLVSASNAQAAQDVNLNQQATNMLNQVQGLLNTQLDGRYLFGGTNTNTPPVDVNAPGFASPPTVYPTSPDTGYYQGNDTKLSARVDDNYDLTYGVTADTPGFEQLVRALRLAATTNVGPPSDANRMNEALGVVKQAIQNIPDITSQIGSAQAAITSVQAKQTDFKQFADKTIGDIANVDVTQAVTKLSQDSTTLEASYQVVARLAQLNLSQFLK